MSGRIVIPIKNENGELVADAGRSIDGSDPKYKVPTDFKRGQVLYNLPRALEGDSTGAVALVEGSLTARSSCRQNASAWR